MIFLEKDMCATACAPVIPVLFNKTGFAPETGLQSLFYSNRFSAVDILLEFFTLCASDGCSVDIILSAGLFHFEIREQ